MPSPVEDAGLALPLGSELVLPGQSAGTGSAVPQGWVLAVAPATGREQREPWAG